MSHASNLLNPAVPIEVEDHLGHKRGFLSATFIMGLTDIHMSLPSDMIIANLLLEVHVPAIDLSGRDLRRRFVTADAKAGRGFT